MKGIHLLYLQGSVCLSPLTYTVVTESRQFRQSPSMGRMLHGILWIPTIQRTHNTHSNKPSSLLLSHIALESHEAPTVVAVTLKRSKTDSFRLGVTLFLGKTGDVVCPVKSLVSYLAMRHKDHGPLLVFQDGSYLTRPRLYLL